MAGETVIPEGNFRPGVFAHNMPVTVNVDFTIPNETAIDLTELGKSQHASATVIVGDIDSQTTQVVFRDLGNIEVGSRILCADTQEVMIVQALPAEEGGAFTVARGRPDETLAVPGVPNCAAAAHPDQTQVFLTQYSGLVEMGRAGALKVIQESLQLMVQAGLPTLTLGTAIQTQQQADEALQEAMQSVMS